MGATVPKETYQKRAAEPDFDFEIKRAYVQKIITTFPADMIARAYAAVLSATCGADQTPFGLKKFGFRFAGLALILVAAKSPLRAWLLLAMLCCFCGYTSIQYALRHAFHTSFIPFFFLGFLVHHAITCFFQHLPARNKNACPSQPPHADTRFIRPIGRAVIWTLLTILLFYIPWDIAARFQHYRVEKIRATYESVPLETVEHTRLRWNNRTLIAPKKTIEAKGFEGKCLLADFRVGILAVSFENVQGPLELRAIYEWENGIGDFGGPLNIAVRRQDEGSGPVILYFPVHEKINSNTDWSRFLGLTMSESALDGFTGLYHVENLDELSLLFNMLLPENKANFIYNQPLSIPWNGRSWKPYSAGSRHGECVNFEKITTALNNKNLQQATLLAQQATTSCQGSIRLTLLLAETKEKAEHIDEANHILADFLETFPHVSAAYRQIDQFFEKNGGVSRRISGWTAIAETFPDLELASVYLAEAQQTAHPQSP